MATRDEVSSMLLEVAGGDHAALARLYGATSHKLFGVVLRVLQNRSDAEEVLQEVYVRIWLNAGRYRVINLSPMTWLITVAHNLAVDRIRQRNKVGSDTVELSVEVADLGPSPEDLAISASQQRRILLGLSTLTLAHAEAVRSIYLHDETCAAVAVRRGLPVNTVKTHLRRGLLQLRLCLDADSSPRSPGSRRLSGLVGDSLEVGPRLEGEVPL